jgi:phage gpG-like protein
MTIKGDFPKLARLQSSLKKLASKDTPVRLANALGAAAITEVELEFRESRDPYGQPWAPLKLRAGGKPLFDTGRLRSSFSAQQRFGGFTIGTNFIGAKAHQYGATIVPKRGKFLRFRGGRGRRTRGVGGRFQFGGGFIFARSVTIPRRPILPEKYLGPRWSKAFHNTAKRFLSRIMKG